MERFYIYMERKYIHIYDSLIAVKLDSLGSVPFFQAESVCYQQDCFSITSDFYPVIDRASVLQCYNPITNVRASDCNMNNNGKGEHPFLYS